MSTFDKNWRTIPTTHGLAMLGLLAAYFLIMRFVGLGHVYWLRALNILFVYFVLRSALRTYRQRSQASYYEDFSDYFRIAVRTAFVGIGLFSVFLAIYLDQLDTTFMQEILTEENISPYLTAVSAAVLIFIEGMTSALACGYILIQVMKARTVEKPLEGRKDLHKETHS
ncbi:MAG TPA: hypothetical protein DCG19_07075 [Cryomorphaceae bacterium]|nr:hypothetical protein [Owenweeksia sp.]HAD97152.1 hypothetical protein [Cryomorphaceae bacterium]HBF19704.1 hypothetical protein [Cryomorphaceae bacterium]|tara:strand:+ start:594 stop:1100 length:507 start_codon:yes stop_codon:yes gene_type:complete